MLILLSYRIQISLIPMQSAEYFTHNYIQSVIARVSKWKSRSIGIRHSVSIQLNEWIWEYVCMCVCVPVCVWVTLLRRSGSDTALWELWVGFIDVFTFVLKDLIDARFYCHSFDSCLRIRRISVRSMVFFYEILCKLHVLQP